MALPLTAAGILLTRELVPPHPPGPHHAYAHDGASGAAAQSVLGFLCSAPFLLSAGVLLTLIVAVRAVQTRRGLRRSAWPLAALVPLGFLVHHHFEHLLGNPAAALGVPLGPALLVGLVLQLPFALLAYLIATALLRVADRLVVALAALRRLRALPSVRPQARQSLRGPGSRFSRPKLPRGRLPPRLRKD